MMKMPCFSIIIVIAILTYYAEAEGQNGFRNDTGLRRIVPCEGIFLNVSEYKENKPSVCTEVLITEKKNRLFRFNDSKYKLKILDYESNKYVVYRKKFFAVYDDSGYYLKDDNGLAKILVKGKYTAYIHSTFNSKGVHIGKSIPLSGEEKNRIILLDIDTEKKHRLTKSYLKKILLQNDSSLYQEFIEIKHRNEDLLPFIIKLNRKF